MVLKYLIGSIDLVGDITLAQMLIKALMSAITMERLIGQRLNLPALITQLFDVATGWINVTKMTSNG